MNSIQDGMMIICGMIAIAILFILSVFISLMITFIFGLPESYLGPLMLTSGVGLIIFIVYRDIREQSNYAKEREAAVLASEIRMRKSSLKIKASDFPDSRKNIARQKLYEEKRNSNKKYDMDIDYSYIESYE